MRKVLTFIYLFILIVFLKLVITFVIKELILLVVGIYIYRKGDNLSGAMWCGKLCTVVLDGSMLLLIAMPETWITDKLTFTIIGAVLAFMGLSFVVYLNAYKKMYQELKKDA